MTIAPLHFLRYVAGLDKPETQTTKRERDCLVTYATGKRRAVEIGVFEGYGTRLIADAMPPGSDLYGIDPFFSGRLGICWAELIARAQVRGASGARVHFVKALSFDAASVLDGEFDFIFIDGDHSTEGIRRDWADWSAKIAPGGIIALHDTSVPDHNPNVANLGSVQYFEETIVNDDRFTRVDRVDSLNVLRRQ